MMLRSSGIINRVKWGFIGVVFIVAQFGPLSLLTNIANAASPSVNLDQWATDNAQWVNGNVNPSKASLREGDSLPYRARFGSLTAAQSYTIQISWDITKGGKHALDYLTTYNRTFTANPCIGVSGCLQATNDTETIPADPNAPAMQVPGVFTLFGGAITSLSAYSMTGNVANDATAYISITFTANVDNPVLAWAGHIASQVDWGFGKSASVVNGSPYHTNLTNFSAGGVGQQDRSLSAAAVYPTPDITTQIYKNSNSLGSNGTIYIGESIKDFATVSKVDRHDPTPSGTVKFYVCYDSANYPDCVTGGNIIGASVALSGGTASSASYTPSNLGYYCVRAQYTPASDAPYSPQNHTNLTTECFRVLPLPNGNLTVTKIVNNMNGGTANISDFELFVNSTQVSSGQQNSFAPGSYTISETQQDGYMLTDVSGSCKKDVYGKIKVDVTSNGSSTCTLTNTDIAPKLTLKKDVKNDNGGTATPDQWTVTATPIANSVGATAISGNGDDGVNSVKAKANVEYILSETGPSGYEFKGWSCNGGSLNGTKLTLELDSDVTCTVTNDDIAPKLTIKKIAINDNGGSTTSDKFELYVGDLPVFINGAATVNNTSTTSSYVASGVAANTTYTLSEARQSNYTPSNWSCTGTGLSGFTQKLDTEKADILLALNADVTCVITNNDDAPALTLVKKLVNNYSTSTASDPSEADWLLTANGPQLVQVTGSKDGVKADDIQKGTYDLSESSVKWDSGSYTSAWSCVKSVAQTNLAAAAVGGDSVTIDLGEHYTCTVTNTMKPATLIVEKQVVNNSGGDKVAGDFSFNYTGGSSTAFSQLPNDTTKAKNELKVIPGTYTITEDEANGYQAEYANCSNLNIGYGETKTCTLTNTDIAPKLTLKKDVKNDNGGTATPDQWTVTATPVTNNVGATTISGNGDDGVNSVKAKANVEYILSETGPSGYEFKGWNCNGGSLNGTKLTLELDSDVTCTVTNDDIAPKLTLIKKVENNDGGNAYAKDWVLKATGPTTISGSGGVTSDESFKKGEYTLSEYGGPYGYVAGEWSCVGANSLAGDVLEVGLGDDISCTITNDDQKGTLIVKKIVVNDDGGKMTAGDFSVTINGNKSYDFEEDLTDNEQGEVKISVPAGHYTVVEDQEDQYGYDTDYDTNREMVCDGVLGDLLSRSYDYDCLKDCEKLYVGNGQTVVCTITNDDIAPHVTLKKQVVNNNSGVSESRDWTLSATPANGSKTISGNGEDGVVEAKAKANVEYLLSENGPSGYKAGSWYCEGGQLRGNVLTLGLDEDAYCVIENNDIEHPGINVVKSGPSNAQTGETVVYTFTVTNTGDTPLSGVVVNDNIAGKGVYKSGDFNNNSYLDLTETWIYTANYVIPQSAVGATVNNTVKACGDMVSNDTNWYDASDSQIVCDDDSHSLKVAAAELVNTGAGSTPLMSILLALIMLAGAIATSRRSDGARQ